MGLNVKVLHLVTKAVGKRFMIPRNYGRILNLSSVKSLIVTTENYMANCASKGAVNMYTKQLACEWGKYRITCNAIAPTFVRTPINSFQLDDPAFYKKLTDRIQMCIRDRARACSIQLRRCSSVNFPFSGSLENTYRNHSTGSMAARSPSIRSRGRSGKWGRS